MNYFVIKSIAKNMDATENMMLSEINPQKDSYYRTPVI